MASCGPLQTLFHQKSSIEKMLVSSFACSYETADIEFELLLSQAMQKGNNLAHHLGITLRK